MSASSNLRLRAPARATHPAEPVRLPGGPGVLSLLREDWRVHDRDWTRPGFRALAAYRLGYWRRGLPAPARQLLYVPVRALQRFARNHYGIELHPTARIGRRLKLPHQHGIVIHHFAVIGDDCELQHGVTLCFANRPDEAPTLGNGVRIGAGAVLYGGISIGDGATIGPNAVVTMDVPAGATVFAPPPRLIPPAGDATG